MEGFAFEKLPLVERFERLADPGVYAAPPGDWWVLVSDVAGSTKAIEAGRYKDVNVLGAASIAAVRNVLDAAPPYAFGGDGATIVVSPRDKPAAAAALNGLAEIAQSSYGLGLRVGGLQISDLQERGATLGIARFRLASPVDLAMFWGDGVGMAEDLVKGDTERWGFSEPARSPDLTGLQCRWKPIRSRNGEMLSVLVKATGANPSDRAGTYAELFDHLERMGIGSPELRPVDSDRLELETDAVALRSETDLVAATEGSRIANTPRVRWTNSIGKLLLKTKWSLGGFDGANYPASLVARTDFRKFDDALRMVVDVDASTRAALELLLNDLHDSGRIAFGLFASDSALMTCLIQDYDTQHVHFIDGSDGGYALAAKGLKAQLRNM